jgi:hypothetical protein
MKKVNFDAWVQLIGMISIVASLFFVGMQMRQSQQIALAGQQQARAAANIAVLSFLTESGIDQQLVFWEENFNYELSKKEIAFRNQLHSIWFLYENDYYQYRQGLMDESTWSAKLVGIQTIYDKCRGRVIYNQRAPMFAEEFRTIIDSFPDECPN